MAILVVPEEEIAVVFCVDFNMPIAEASVLIQTPFAASCSPCVHLEERLWRAWQVVDEVVGLRLLLRHDSGEPCYCRYQAA